MPIQLTSQAYCKMLLHAAKYPHSAVNGLLVAEKAKARKKDSLHDPVLCVDCVPLFHGTLALAPMLEVALTLVSPFSVTIKIYFIYYIDDLDILCLFQQFIVYWLMSGKTFCFTVFKNKSQV